MHICAQQHYHRKQYTFSLTSQQLMFSHLIQPPHILSSRFTDTTFPVSFYFKVEFYKNSYRTRVKLQISFVKLGFRLHFSYMNFNKNIYSINPGLWHITSDISTDQFHYFMLVTRSCKHAFNDTENSVKGWLTVLWLPLLFNLTPTTRSKLCNYNYMNTSRRNVALDRGTVYILVLLQT